MAISSPTKVIDNADALRTPRELIEFKTSELLRAYQSEPAVRPAFRSINNLTTQATHEYGNRFLFELIQNAFDAHLELARDGVVHIKLARDEAEHGVLYVANGGRPFGASNFEAICQLAQSSKVPGEGIGNKGIGFRSVLQICKWPEVYSRATVQPDSSGFSGFCFGFARPEKVRELLEDDELYADIVRDVSPYALPVALTEQPEAVRRFAREGFATVIRLPLKSGTAFDAVKQQMGMLRNAQAPVMLFLDRLAKLVIEDDLDDGCIIEMTRGADTVPTRGEGPASFEVVNLGGQGRYFVAAWRVDEARLMEKIDESLRAELLPTSWAEWKGSACVSVAVRVDAEGVVPCLYNFLPMSRASSPFNGYLNAPFYAKTDRTDLHEEVPLNSFFLDVAAGLAAKAAAQVKRSRADYSPAAAVDLLAWGEKDRHRLEEAFVATEESVYEAELVPVLPDKAGKKWATLKEVYSWPRQDLRVLDAKTVVKASGAKIIQPALGRDRERRLSVFCALRRPQGFNPPPQRVAAWVDDVAASLLQHSSPLARWDQFYDDVAKLFGAEEGPLVGRRILLGADQKLHQCGQPASAARSGTTVFFPPSRNRGEGEESDSDELNISIPQSLARHISYMHPGLAWVVQEGRGRKQTAARAFFEGKGLIKAFETRDLLGIMASLLAKTKSDNVRADALKWTYGLQRSVNYNQKPGLDEINLHVPTESGWLPAQEAFFSAAWTQTNGPLLAKLVREAKTVSQDLGEIEGRFILSPESWPFKLGDAAAWAEFLKKAGVRDGLWPVKAADVNEEHNGNYFLRPTRLDVVRLMDAAERQTWVKEVDAANRFPAHPITPYRLKGALWRLPGQADYSKFSEPARRSYAQLVMSGLPLWPDGLWAFSLYRPWHYNKPDAMSWPTPLLCFLKSTTWIPMSQPRDRDKWEFQRPADAWHFSEIGEDATPAFAPLIPKSLRRLIDKEKKSQEILKSHLKLKVWNDPQYSTHLVRYLGRLHAAGEVGDLSADAFRKVYAAAWSVVLERGVDPFAAKTGSPFLVVSRGGKLAAVDVRGEAARGDVIYVVDCEDPLRLNLLVNLGLPVFDVGERKGEAAAKVLRQNLGERVKTVSSTEVKILVDGEQFMPDAGLPPLITAESEWLKTLIALTLEFRSLLPAHRSDRNKQAVLKRLGDVRLKGAYSVAIRMDGQDSPPPPGVGDVIPVEHDLYPTLVVSGGVTDFSWQLLELIATPLARLLGYPSVAVPLQLAVVLLARRFEGRDTPAPTDSDFAYAFSEREERVREIRLALKGSAAALLDDLRPVVYHFAGAEAAEQFSDQNEALTTEDAIMAALSAWADRFDMTPREIVQACREAEGLSDLRDRLGISHADFNHALLALGLPYRPIRNPEGHRHALAYYKQQNREQVLISLRQKFLADFNHGGTLTEYAHLRTLESLTPDPGWLDLCETPTDAMLLERTNSWLAAVGAPAVGEAKSALPPVEEARRKNLKFLEVVINEMAAVVPIWCWKNNVSTPPMWGTADPSGQIKQAADTECLLDFELLGNAKVISWLRDKGHWPRAMPATTDRNELCLTKADVERREQEIASQKNAYDLGRRSIEINNKPVLAEPQNYASIAELVAGTVTNRFLASPRGMAKLAEIKGSGGGKGGGGGGWGGGYGGSRPSEQQRGAIGLVGEVLTFHWLKHHYGDDVNDASWKSSYRNYVLGGTAGSDSLGYDFEVIRKRDMLMFEVKASSSERAEIELGETEVERAQQNHRNNRYRIIYIANVLDPRRRYIRVLPNPFSDRGHRLFRLAGTGLRYQFKITE